MINPLSSRLATCCIPAVAELFGVALRRLRTDRAWSRDRLSSEIARAGDRDVPVSTLRSYESGNDGRIPDAEIIEAIAAGLGVDPDVFYEWPIALARRDARTAVKPSVASRARKAGRRLSDTRPTSREKPDARDGAGGAP